LVNREQTFFGSGGGEVGGDHGPKKNLKKRTFSGKVKSQEPDGGNSWTPGNEKVGKPRAEKAKKGP